MRTFVVSFIFFTSSSHADFFKPGEHDPACLDFDKAKASGFEISTQVVPNNQDEIVVGLSAPKTSENAVLTGSTVTLSNYNGVVAKLALPERRDNFNRPYVNLLLNRNVVTRMQFNISYEYKREYVLCYETNSL